MLRQQVSEIQLRSVSKQRIGRGFVLITASILGQAKLASLLLEAIPDAVAVASIGSAYHWGACFKMSPLS